jgi:hypothetical protein
MLADKRGHAGAMLESGQRLGQDVGHVALRWDMLEGDVLAVEQLADVWQRCSC